MIDLVRQLMASVAREDSVDYVEVTLRDGPPRAELDAALGTPEALPRMPGPAFRWRSPSARSRGSAPSTRR